MSTTPLTSNPGAGESVDSTLDEAYERMARSDFELPNGFVNHGPMACEALAALGYRDQIDGWSRWFAQEVREGPEPVQSNGRSTFDWSDALGKYVRLPEWLGFYEQFIADSGWESAIEVWVPRLMPGLTSALFHGAIRTAHAARALSVAETQPRQDELVRSLAYWSARFRPGQEVARGRNVQEVPEQVIDAAADGASHYVSRPSIFYLHGVTGAMAVEILVHGLPPAAAEDALRQLWADHEAMYTETRATVSMKMVSWDNTWADRATQSRDAHQVKLVEACRRGFDASGDLSLAAAAERVVR